MEYWNVVGLSLSGIFLLYSTLQKNRIKWQKKKSDQLIDDFSKLKDIKKGEAKYFKAKISPNSKNRHNFLLKQIDIHYNEYYIEEPSDYQILSSVDKQMWRKFMGQNQWQFQDIYGKKTVFNTIHQLLGDPYKIQKSYQIDDKGFFKNLLGWVSYCFSFLFDAIRRQQYFKPQTEHIPKVRRPFIKGPIIGKLKSSIGLIANSYFILRISSQNGELSIDLLADSKQSLINLFDSKVFCFNMLIFLSTFMGLYTGYNLYKSYFKAKLKNLIKKIKSPTRNKVLSSIDIEDDKICIICYTNCRNLLFFDCRHLIMCDNCWQAMKNQTCPVCKGEIKNACLIYQQVEEEKEIGEIKQSQPE